MAAIRHKDRETAARSARPLTAAAVLVAVALPLVLYARTMPPTITWWFGGADSGDLVPAADVLGIPHPTGYPLFVLLGHAATRIPWGEIAGRINAMNAVLAALGAGATALAVLPLTDRPAGGTLRHPGVRPAAACLAALAVATSSLYWSQAIIGEVYALHAALTALVLWVWARRTHPALRGAAHGLALTNHLTSLILLGAALVAYARPGRSSDRWRRGGWFALGLTVPLLLYALLPVRAARHPAANWGDPETPGRFLAHVTGRQYQELVDWRDVGGALRTLPPLVRLVVGDLPPWTPVVAAFGAAVLWRRRRPYAVFTATAAGGVLLFCAVYRVPDRAPYLLPAYVVLGVWSGVGLVDLAEALAGWATDRRWWRGGRAVTWAGAGAVLLLAVWAVRAGRRVDLHGDDSAVVFARATLERLPAGATYYSARDDVTFALWYAQRSLGIRPDVRVVDVRNPGLSDDGAQSAR
jgi:hypothetical protein